MQLISNRRFASLIALTATLSGTAPTLASPPDQLSPFGSVAGALMNSIQNLHLQNQFMSSLQREGREARITQIIRGHGVETRRFQIMQDGLEVVGAETLTHQGPRGLDLTSPVPRMDLSTTPGVDPRTAARLAREHLAHGTGDRSIMRFPRLKILPNSDRSSGTLVYWIEIAPKDHEEGREIILNAHNGSLIGDISHHYEIDSTADNHVRITDALCQTAPAPGQPEALDPSACPTAIRGKGEEKKEEAIADDSSRNAYRNAQQVLDYYAGTHGRNSFDGAGSELMSVVHVGNKFANAFWSSDQDFMAYGDGDGVQIGDLTLSVDVAGHEMTHGVTAKTAKLIYMSESGALNEAFSDFFGVAIAAHAKKAEPDWAIAKDIFLGERKSIGLRNLKDPSSIQARFRTKQGDIEPRPYPSKLSEKFEDFGSCTRENDRCYVHVNSMIPGHAMQLMADAIGLEQAEKLLYLTLTQYLSAGSDFKAFKEQTLKACPQVLDEKKCASVEEAFKQVEL